MFCLARDEENYVNEIENVLSLHWAHILIRLLDLSVPVLLLWKENAVKKLTVLCYVHVGVK